MRSLLRLYLLILSTLGFAEPQATQVSAHTQDVSDIFISAVAPEHPGPYAVRWEPNRKSWGYGSQTIWLFGRLQNPSDQPVQKVLSLPYSSPTVADFTIYDDAGRKIKEMQGGTFSPIAGRDLKLNLVGVVLDIPAHGTLSIFIRQQSKSFLGSHYVLRSVEDHQTIEWIYLTAYGFYFGLAMALFFHNLTLYFSVRDPVYLAYLGYVFCSAATMLFSSAFYGLFWYRLPAVLHNVPYATPALVNIGAAIFACHYLHLRIRYSWLARAFLLTSMISLLLVVVHLGRPDLATPWNPYVNLMTITIVAAACVLRLMQGERYAWFLLAAVLTPMLTVSVYYIGNLILHVSVPSDIISVAFGLEMLLMSAGLSHRVYVLRQRQHMMQAQQATMIHQSKMRALAEMASGVAHEVNNPLMIIGGYAEVIRRLIEHEPIESGSVRDYTVKIDRNVNRIAFIVQALRSFARDDHEQEHEPIVFGEIVQQALALCATRIQDRGIRLDVNLGTDECLILGVESQVMDVILALLDNAMEALRDMPEKRMQVILSLKSGRVRLVIEDSGAGIPEEFQSRLFQPFFTTRSVGEGAGLSLSRSLGVVQSMHGQLFYERQGTVTRFVMELPRWNL